MPLSSEAMNRNISHYKLSIEYSVIVLAWNDHGKNHFQCEANESITHFTVSTIALFVQIYRSHAQLIRYLHVLIVLCFQMRIA